MLKLVYNIYKKKFRDIEERIKIEESKGNNPKKLWNKWKKVGRKLFREDSRLWRKEFNKLINDWEPYSAGSYILETIFLMVDRCYQYWSSGWNVWATEDYSKPILESVSAAKFLVDEIRAYPEEYDYCDEDGKFIPEVEELLRILFTEASKWSV